MNELFKSARVIQLSPNGNGGELVGEADMRTVQMGDDLTTLATIKALAKNLDTIIATYDAKVKARMATEFAEIALSTGKRPVTFRGVSPKAEASCQLRRRAKNMLLSEDEVTLLEAADIPLEVDIICEAVPERYFFNPDIIADDHLADKIVEALQGIPELQGLEIVIKQAEQQAKTRKVVPEEALDAVAGLKDKQLIQELLPIVSTLAIRVKLVSELSDAINMLKAAEVQL